MVSNIILVNDKSDIEIIPENYFQEENCKIYSLELNSHEKLTAKKIPHEIGDSLLLEEERLQIFDKCNEFALWHSSIPNSDFIFNGVNLLKIFDSHEFYSFLMPKLIKIKIIKKILEKEQPEKIISTTFISDIINILISGSDVKSIFFEDNSKNTLFWEKINLKYNFGPIPISFSISRVTYMKIKNFLESIYGFFYNFWLKKTNNTKSIVLLEFNTESFSNLLVNLKNYDGQIILINERRPAIWNKKTLDIIKKSGCKILKSEFFLTKNEKNQIQSLGNSYSKKFYDLWENSKQFNELFLFEGINLWIILKEFFINIYSQRLNSYISLILSSTKIFKNIDLRCILSLNETGESEKIFLEINKKKVPSILLEHGFVETIDKTLRFEQRNHYSSISDMIAVWGEITKKRLIENYNIPSKQILISGSPRHDDYFKSRLKPVESNEKILLLAPNPINGANGISGVDIKIEFNKLMKKIFQIIKKYDNVKVHVKLHPIQLKHNQEMISLIKQIDKSIPIYLSTSVIDIINRADAVLVITPEIHATPTIILESMILGKPVMNIHLNDTIPEYNYIQKETVLAIRNKDLNLEKYLEKIIFDNDFRNILQKNADNYVSEFMSFSGNASENLSSILKKLS